MGSRKRKRFASRSGMTLMEVMFAIAIAMVGLLGIASLIPLAGRNAAESTRAAEGQALANLWYDELMVRGIANPSNWQWFQDFSTQNSTAGYKPYSVMKEAVCIDPRFFADNDVATGLAAGAFNRPTQDKQRWYRPSVFPYYHENYNPLVDPAYTVTAASSYAWATQPRMLRMTLAGALGRVPARFLDELLSSTDDLAIDVENDDASIPPTRHLNNASPAVTMGRMASKGEYSWLITICPTDTLTHNDPVDQALLSLAVIQRRDLVFFNPNVSPPVKTSGVASDPEEKPAGERVFWVVPQTDTSGQPVPFKGGHGGTVTLMATDGISSTVHVGDWVMLAKNRTAAGFPIYRWFRIVATDGEAEYTSSSLVPSGDQVWSLKVVLQGPDWVFDTSPSFYTTATYIPGTVAVHERIIPY